MKPTPEIHIIFPDPMSVIKIPELAETISVEAFEEMVSRYVFLSKEETPHINVLQIYEHIKKDVDKRFLNQILYWNLLKEYPRYTDVLISDNSEMLMHKLRTCINEGMNKMFDSDTAIIKYSNNPRTSFPHIIREMLLKHYYVWNSNFDGGFDTIKIAQLCVSCRLESDRILVPIVEHPQAKVEPFCAKCELAGYYNKEVFRVGRRNENELAGESK